MGGVAGHNRGILKESEHSIIGKNLSILCTGLLLANKMKSELKWELQTEQIYRNSISFLVGPYDTTKLKLTSMYLEVAMLPSEVQGERVISIEAVCAEVRHCIAMAVREVTSSLHYTSDAEHALAFYCTGRHETGQERHPAEVVFFWSEPCSIQCEMRRGKRSLNLPSGFQQWFGKVKSNIAALMLIRYLPCVTIFFSDSMSVI